MFVTFPGLTPAATKRRPYGPLFCCHIKEQNLKFATRLSFYDCVGYAVRGFTPPVPH